MPDQNANPTSCTAPHRLSSTSADEHGVCSDAPLSSDTDPCLPIARHQVRAMLRGNGPATVTHGERGNLRPPGCSREDAAPGRPPLRLRCDTTCLRLPSCAARTGPVAEVHPSAARAARRYVPSRRVAAAVCDARSIPGVRVHPGAALRRVGSPGSVGGARGVSQVHCQPLLQTADREEWRRPRQRRNGASRLATAAAAANAESGGVR